MTDTKSSYHTYRVIWSKKNERWEASVDKYRYLRAISYDSPGDAINNLCEILDALRTQELVLDAARVYCREMFNYDPKNYNKGQEGADKHVENDAKSYLNPRELTLWLEELVQAAIALRKPLNPPDPNIPEAVKEELNPLQRPPTVTLYTGYKD